MTQSSPETRQCPHCGTVNDIANALCERCKTPLTAYAGQLTGEAYQGRLAGQVALLERQPPVVIAMAIFNVLFAVFWPLATVMRSFQATPHVNEEGTNYAAAAFTTIGPILSAILLVPIALAILVLAWATWAQRTWAWTVNAFFLGGIALLAILKFSTSHTLAFIYAGLACGLAYFWFQQKTKAWYGL